MKKYLLAGLFFWISFTLNAQKQVEIWVDGSCAICKERIETAAMQMMGINSASWDQETKILSLDTDSNYYEEDLLTHLASVGHDTKSYLATLESVENFSACCSYMTSKKNPSPPQNPVISKMENPVELWVDGICGMCQERIENACSKIKGVKSSFWDVDTRILTIDVSSDFDLAKVHKKMAKIGHDTELEKASDKVYANLHECCKYRDPDVIAAHSDESVMEVENWDDHADHSNDIHGILHEINKEGKKSPLVGATIHWLGTKESTVSDAQGFFTLEKVENVEEIVVQYVGFQPDTINMGDQHIVDIVLRSNFILDEISITHKKKTTEISFLNTMKVRQITEKELLKAACCSLSESFETTPSVDVSFTDAVTGTRKIELLGLAGPNVQIMRENIPYIRGLAALNGLSLTPGPWVESMQLNIGSGSVINGPEALTGQINVEIKKPKLSEKVFAGIYANQWERYEANANTTVKVSDQLHTAVILHSSTERSRRDRNRDGFLDNPLSNTFSFVNRWKLETKNNLNSQIGIKYANQNKLSGQIPEENPTDLLWQANQKTERLESWYKLGKVFEKHPNFAIAYVMNYTFHNQESNFGLKQYNGKQSSFYANLILSQRLEGLKSKFNYGLSFQYDNFQEHLSTISYLRKEVLPGVFTEYNTNIGDAWSFVFGLRGDYHNNYGFLVSPRVHAKYAPSEYQAWRFVAGRGLRTPSIFAENIGMFASSREIIVEGENDTPYGLGQDIAWNTGLSYTQEVQINDRSLIFGGEYYFTYFENNVLVDFDTDLRKVYIYNAPAGTTGHSVQVHAEYEIIKDFSLKAAYRFNDVRSDYKIGRLLKPLSSRHRAFLNASVELPKRWSIDGTFNLQGRKRIPTTEANPIQFELDEYSPVFYTINAQVSKFFKNGIEVYLGAENILDFHQHDAILESNNPFGEYFDSSLIWGPIMGRNIYGGVRYRLF